MGWVTGIVVYLLTWWIVLFMVLPVGVESEDDPDVGHMPGAPKNPGIKLKFMATTAISAFLWLIIYVLIETNLIDLYDVAYEMRKEDLGG